MSKLLLSYLKKDKQIYLFIALGIVFILFPGVSVELSSGEKALIINENPSNILKPTVITFRQNRIMDLSDSENDDIRVVDIMKTLDNRYIMSDSSTDSSDGSGISTSAEEV